MKDGHGTGTQVNKEGRSFAQTPTSLRICQKKVKPRDLFGLGREVFPEDSTNGAAFVGGGGLLVAHATNQPISETLHGLNKDDENHDHGKHDIRHEALVAVSNAHVTQTTAADGAGHG